MGLFDRLREKAEAAVDAVKERLPGQHAPEPPAAPATTEGEPTTDAAEARATPAAGDTSPAPAPAPAAEGAEGTVVGAGLARVYISRAGDTLEAIAGYFYGDPVHRQRLLDDNPALDLAQYSGTLPGGLRLKVSEDPRRGDAVRGPRA